MDDSEFLTFLDFLRGLFTDRRPRCQKSTHSSTYTRIHKELTTATMVERSLSVSAIPFCSLAFRPVIPLACTVHDDCGLALTRLTARRLGESNSLDFFEEAVFCLADFLRAHLLRPLARPFLAVPRLFLPWALIPTPQSLLLVLLALPCPPPARRFSARRPFWSVNAG